MKLRTLLTAGSVSLACLATTSAFAQASSPAPAVDQRQDAQHNRIKEGRQSGDLTHREAKRLHAEQRIIKHKEKRAAADGVVTQKEQKHLDRMQDMASKDIKKQKHDEQAPAAK